jgi:predicted NAD/FAD-binding protein
VIATINTTPIYIQPTHRIHNTRTSWNNYRTKLHEEINLHISLKSCTEIEEAINNFISLLQEAAQQATPTIVYKKCCEHPIGNEETVGREKKNQSNRAKKSHPVRQNCFQ